MFKKTLIAEVCIIYVRKIELINKTK